MVLADIDHFKKVNDTYGHQAGDEVLMHFSDCINQQIRKKVDWVVRYGGEEFLIVLPETRSLGARSMAERLRASVEEKTIQVGDHAIQITASFGGACISFENKRFEEMTMDQLIFLADENLYKSKENGRNQVNIVDFKDINMKVA